MNRSMCRRDNKLPQLNHNIWLTRKSLRLKKGSCLTAQCALKGNKQKKTIPRTKRFLEMDMLIAYTLDWISLKTCLNGYLSIRNCELCRLMPQTLWMHKKENSRNEKESSARQAKDEEWIVVVCARTELNCEITSPYIISSVAFKFTLRID